MRHVAAVLAIVAACALVQQASYSQVPPAPSRPAATLFRIAGVVLSANGSPLPQSRVQLAAAAGPPIRKSLVTGPDASFVFADLPKGKYQLYAQHVGFPHRGLDEHEGFITAVAVGPDLDSEHIVFRLEPEAVISGAIVDEFQEPVRSAQVRLFRRMYRQGSLTTVTVSFQESDDQGLYKFSNLTPGTYFVLVTGHPWYARPNTNRTLTKAASEMNGASDELDVAYPAVWYSGATDESTATPLQIKPGEHETADFSVRAIRCVRLHVTNPEAGAQHRSTVMLFRSYFDNFDIPVDNVMTMFQDDGMDVFGIPPGRYRLLLSTNSEGSKGPVKVEREVDLSGDTTVALSGDDAPALASVSGSLSAAGSTRLPATGQVVFSDRVHHRNYRGTVTAKGTFGIDSEPGLPPGRYEISISNAPDWFVTSIVASNAKASGRTLTIAGTTDVQLVVTVAKGLGQIDGTVVRDGKPLGGTMVELVPDDPAASPMLFRRDQSDSDGTFTLPQVVPGRYTVIALEHGWDLEWSNRRVLAPYLAKGDHVQVSPAGKYNVSVASQP